MEAECIIIKDFSAVENNEENPDEFDYVSQPKNANERISPNVCDLSLQGKVGSQGREFAIQTNTHEIERCSGQLPLRKRFVPLKLSDYCVYANNVKNEEEEEEEESTFVPKDQNEMALETNKTKRSRGRPRKKNVDNDIPETSTTKDSDPNRGIFFKKNGIVKVSKGFKCTLCGKIFSLRGNAKAHLVTHTDDKPFTCDFQNCGKHLRTKESLRRHKLSHLGIKMFECTKCKHKFSCNLSLQEHMNLHTGEKPLTCNICGVKFRQIAVLKRHMTTHSKDKPFACQVCGKRFSLQVYVRSHMKTHTGERPFKCDVCNKCFAHGSDLNRHRIIHSGKKPYECSVCSMRYSDPSSRRRHEREHENKEQFICHVCNQQFPRAGQLRLHLVKEHGPFNSVNKGQAPSVSNLIEDRVKISSTVEPSTQMTDLDRGSHTLGLDIISKSSVEKLSTLSADNHSNSRTSYQLISSGDGCQIFELKMDKHLHSQLPAVQDLGREVTIDLQTIKIETLIQNGSTLSILNPNNENLSVLGTKIITTKPANLDNDIIPQKIDNFDSRKSADEEKHSRDVELPKDASISFHTMQSELSTVVTDNNDIADQQLGQVAFSKSVTPADHLNTNSSRVHTLTFVSSNFIDHPDFGSQDYFNWLSSFSEECKQFVMPLSKEMFQKISTVQKALCDFMAMPRGVIADKTNFQILMGIAEDLSQITSSHLSFMFTNLDK